MTAKKKQLGKTGNTPSLEGAGAIIHPVLDHSGQKDELGNEPWRKWKVKPDLVPMIGGWPAGAGEAGISKRIAYCRGQLDNLSVEALARYTKYFDQVGISKASIVRYEGGDSFPGARELRILCDALWVSPNWLLLGTLDSNLQHHAATKLIDALTDFVQEVDDNTNKGFIFSAASDLRKGREKMEIEKRQRWIDETTHHLLRCEHLLFYEVYR